ncbi:MarR family winged helix-turn-helix transcriptional regulator [Terrabacter sp. 2TAF16]|jgi:DNA-binding MarR family transcriptional regulator|uniref:MarR family winged helix-turn-helix transcriptional regulator n=1 Tax=unclassified Terrabacter TaxID=2630222 RepID=UPI0006F82083|nr:MarR family transcriptional regulator [Terrabacter sp. Soil811]KRF45768.1 transcriptional regulator [Terrabacter sp. Soil811]
MEHHEDHAQHVVDQWAAVRPELDVTPVLVIGRLHRVALALTTELVKVYNAHGLGEGDFDVLATLRRTGEPHELTPTELMDQTMVTSGAVTKRLDRLEGAGLVERRVAGGDRRSRIVVLTEKGRELIDRAAPEHFANEARLLEPLSTSERATLARLLGKLGASLGV